MELALETVLILTLAVLTVAALPVVWRLRAVARSLDRFLVETAGTVGRITEDVHVTRVRMDGLARAAQGPILHVASFLGVMSEDARCRAHHYMRTRRRRVEARALALGRAVGRAGRAFRTLERFTSAVGLRPHRGH